MSIKKTTVLAIILLLALVLTGCGAARMVGGAGAAGAQAAEITTLSRGPLSVTISAIGNVRPAQTVTLAWQTGGKVGQVNTATGQKVNQDDVLASLDPTSLSNAILSAQVELIEAQNALDALYDPDPLSIAQAEDALEQAQESLENLKTPSESAIAEANLAVIAAQDEVEDAEYKVNSLTNGRGNAQLIAQARANVLIAQDRVDQLQVVYNNTPGKPEEDAGKAQAFSSLEAAKKDRDRAQASLNWYLGTPSEQEMAEAETKLALAQARLAEAQQTLADLQAPNPSAISLAEAKVADAQETLDELLNGPSEDEFTIAQTRLTQAQASVNQAHLTAPIAGTVTKVQSLQGDVVNAGEEAVRIDNLTTMYLDLSVSEIDIQQIQVGQAVLVAIDAYPDQQYTGQVVEIGQVGSNTQGVVSFTVTVEIANPDETIKPGMTAEASIQIAEAEDVLQLPSRFIFNDMGKTYVYRQNGEEVEQVFIQTGVSSDTAVEVISSELKEGDQITNQSGGFQFGGGDDRGEVRMEAGEGPGSGAQPAGGGGLP
jgi:HlyD family secretion protein